MLTKVCKTCSIEKSDCDFANCKTAKSGSELRVKHAEKKEEKNPEKEIL